MAVEKNGKIFLTSQEVKILQNINAVINGVQGGLVLGSSHSDGGINVIRKCEDAEMYELIIEMEGWEYILCHEATTKNLGYLQKINNELKENLENFIEYSIPENIKILDLNPFVSGLTTINKFLLVESGTYFIINKFSSKKYLKELDFLNKKYCS